MNNHKSIRKYAYINICTMYYALTKPNLSKIVRLLYFKLDLKWKKMEIAGPPIKFRIRLISKIF